MSFKTISAILRGGWLLDKQWADAHMPLVISVLKGEGSLASMFADDDREKEEEKAMIPQRVVSGGVVYKVGYYTDLTRIPEGAIAMIDINGPIMKYGGMCSYGSLEKSSMIMRADNAPNIKGTILNIDSPGGQVAGTTDLADTVKNTKKPIIAVINDGMAASAAMWVASACDEIYVTKKTDQVGSIGVYATLLDYASKLEAQGIKVHEIYAPQSTEKNKDYLEAMKGNYGLVQEDLRVIADEFISTVSVNRAGKLQSDAWKAGKMFYGKEAAKMGLIDGVKSLDQVIKRMDQLIASKSQNSTSNKMSAFQKTLGAAKAESFAVVEGGFLLQEEHLNSIEAQLVESEAAVATANDSVTAANTARDTAVAAQQTAEQAATTANSTIAERDAEITRLNARVTELEASTVPPQQTVTDADKTGNTVVASWEDPKSPANAAADKFFGRKKKAS